MNEGDWIAFITSCVIFILASVCIQVIFLDQSRAKLADNHMTEVVNDFR